MTGQQHRDHFKGRVNETTTIIESLTAQLNELKPVIIEKINEAELGAHVTVAWKCRIHSEQLVCMIATELCILDALLILLLQILGVNVTKDMLKDVCLHCNLFLRSIFGCCDIAEV